jgi:hypothetical protein
MAVIHPSTKEDNTIFNSDELFFQEKYFFYLLLATFINMGRIEGPTAETLSKGAENRESYQTKFEISLTPTPFADETTCIFTYFGS